MEQKSGGMPTAVRVGMCEPIRSEAPMRAVVQRVIRARVDIAESPPDERREIGRGLLVYLGVGREDGQEDARVIVEKVANLRILADAAGKMNRSVLQLGGQVLVVPAFTVQADARKGRRPSFDSAAAPDLARPLFVAVCEGLESAGLSVVRGVFGAHMEVDAVNDGPICILLDSQRVF